MARFDCDGLDELIQQMTDVGELLNGETADKMLMAGAEQVKIAWQNAADQHGHRDTGAMIESIGYKRPQDVGGMRSVDIAPQGSDAKGVRNAEKAFILNYGTSRIKASHWVDDADKACEATVVPAMAAVFDAAMAEKGL